MLNDSPTVGVLVRSGLPCSAGGTFDMIENSLDKVLFIVYNVRFI